MKQLIGAILARPVGTISLAIAVGLVGFGAVATSPISLLPPIDVPAVVVRAEYDGLPAAEMRESVTMPLERGLSGLTGLRRIESTTRAGSVSVQLTFDWSVSSAEAASLAREAIDTLYPTLPNAVRRPSVGRTDPTAAPAVRLALFPRSLSAVRVRRLAEREIRSSLQQLEGVGTVVVAGGEIEEVHVRIDQERAGELGVDTATVRAALTEGNREYAAGSLFDGDLELFVTTDARVSSVAELGEIYLDAVRPNRNRGASRDTFGPLPLSAVATLHSGRAPRRSVFQVAGEEAVGIDIYPLPGASPAEVARRVSELLPELRDSFGTAAAFEIVHERSTPIREAISELAFAVLLGAVAAVTVLFLTLREIRSALIVAVSIPLSGSFASAVMAAIDVNLNTMSLAGLAIGIGMVVDNSIVVVENLSARRVDPRDREEIAERVCEVTGATLSGTLTTVAVFLPLFAFRGIAGHVYGDLATAVIAALAGSYLVSISVTPVLFRSIGRRPGKRIVVRRAAPVRLPGAPRWYRSLLRHTLRQRTAAIMLPVVLAAFAGFIARTLPVALSEPVDEGEVEVQLSFSPERSIEAAARDAARLGQVLSDYEEVVSVVAQIGGESDDPRFLADHTHAANSGELTLLLTPGTSARELAERLNARWTLRTMEVNARLPEGELSRLLRFGGGTGIAVYGESAEIAIARAEQLSAELPGPVVVSPVETRPSIAALPDRDVLDHRGISLSEAGTTVRSAVEGAVSGRLVRDGEEIDIRLYTGDVDRSGEVQRIHLPSPSSGARSIPLGEAFRLEERNGPATLVRRGRRDVLFLRGAGDESEIAAGPASSWSESPTWVEHLAEDAIAEQIDALLPVFALAVVIVAAILAVQFEGFVEPAIVLGMLPVAFAGATVALHLAGRALTVQSALGALVLIGIVGNSAIVLIETWKRDEQLLDGRNLSLAVVVYRGVIRRLRPIAMTTATTVAVMLPLAVDPGIRSHQSGLAIAVIGGLIAGTLITLFAVPALYLTARRR